MVRGKAGFTLIELLVVIVIISILAAILFPVFNRAKLQANDTKQLTQLHQLGIAFNIYLADNDDYYPDAYSSSEGVNQVGGWIYYSHYHRGTAGVFDPTKGSIYEYIKSSAMYEDPLEPDIKSTHNSFSINSFIVPYVGFGLNLGKASTAIPDPTHTMMLGEETTVIFRIDHPTIFVGPDDGFFNQPDDSFAQWHVQGSLVLFCDSRAKMVDANNQYTQTICGRTDECDE